MPHPVDVFAPFSGSPVPSALLRVDGHIVRANGAFAGLAGAAALSGGSFLDLVSVFDRANVGRALAAFASHDAQAWTGTVELSSAAGARRSAQLALWRSGPGSENAGAIVQVVLLGSGAADDDVRRREAALRLALEAGHMGVWHWDARRGEGYMSPEVRRLHGLDPRSKALDLDAYLQLVHPDDRDRLRRAIASGIESGAAHETEYRVILPDGSQRWMLGVARTDAGGSGRATLLCGVCVDITERKRADEELRLRDERHRAFLATSTEGIWRCELEAPVDTRWPIDRQIEAFFDHGVLAECNDAMARMYGFERPEELLGARLEDLLVRSNPANREYLERFIRSGYRLHGHESHERDRHGAPRVFENTLVGIREGEFLVRAWGTQVDITEWKTAREREAFLASAAQALASSLDYRETLRKIADLAVPFLADWCAVDMLTDGPEVERVAVAHGDPERLARVREIGRRWPERLDWEGAVSAVVKTRRSLLIPSITPEMLAAGSRDPEHLAMLQSLSLRSAMIVPFIARERVLGAFTLVLSGEGREYTDTDLRVAEDLASRAAMAIDNSRLYEEARAANEAKDEFLARLSHELRTPLNAALGWTQLLQLSASPVPLAQGLAVIERNTRALARIIEDLLDFSRTVRSSLTVVREPIDAAEVVAQAITAVEPLAAEQGLTIRHDVNGEVPLTGDPARIQQVVWNLLTNAIKFTPPGGEITVRTRRTSSGADITVSDTGRGIPHDLLEEIFDPFRQVSHGAGGLGLGLAIARQIVESHGGTIEAASNGPDAGATFVVHLPAA